MPNINHTIIIIAITTLISFICFSNDKLKGQLIFYPPAVKQGQLYRFFSYGFIHADGMHLLFNMFTLYFFGSLIELLYQRYLGMFGFVLFYLAALLVSIFPSYLANINNPNYASLGASGAVSAVLFAFILIAPWEMLYLLGIVPIPAIIFAILYTAYSIYAGKRGRDNINHSAHLWGAAFGVLATIAMKPDLLTVFWVRLLTPF